MEAGAVVGLVSLAVDDVLVVVNAVMVRLVETSLLGGGERRDVPDVSDKEAIVSGRDTVILVVLVVEDQELLPLLVEQPTLVGVGGTLVGGTGDDGGVGLVSDVVDGEGVLVVAVADLAALVLSVGTVVDDTLSIVDVAILRVASRASGVGGVGQINEDQASSTGRIGPGGSADSVRPVGFLVDDNVVGAANGQASEETSQILIVGEGDRAGGINIQELERIS